MSPTRRTVLKSTAALAAAGLLPRVAGAAVPEDIAVRLARDLADRIRPGADTRIEVVALTPADMKGRVRFDAVLQMHWPPGLRRKPVAGDGADGEAAYRALLSQALDTFAAPNPSAFSA